VLADVTDFGLARERRFTACQRDLDSAFPSAREDRRDLIGSESQPVPAGLNRLGHDDDTFIEQHARDPSDLLTRPTTTFDHAAPQAFEENRSGPLPPEQQGVGQMGISPENAASKHSGAPALAKTATRMTNGHDHYRSEDEPALAPTRFVAEHQAVDEIRR